MSDASGDDAELLEELGRLPAAQRAAALRRRSDPAAAMLALIAQVERLAVTEVSHALGAAEWVQSLADETGDALARVRARRARAQSLAYGGRFEEALPLYPQAAELAERAGLPVEAARARMSSVHALASLGRFDEAIAAGQAARRAFSDAAETGLVARADSNLGATYQMCDRPAEALKHFDLARDALRDDPVALAQIESNRGHALLSLDSFVAAEAAYRAALPVFEQQEMTWAAAIVEGNLAELSTRQGRLQDALFHFERTRRHLEKDSAPGELARVLVEQADALAVLGMPAEAAAQYERAIAALDEHGLAMEATRARAGLGKMMVRLDRMIDAAPLLSDAAARFAQLGHQTARARLDLIRAELAADARQFDLAEEICRAALDALSDRPADSAAARYHLARIALARGDLPRAESELARAIPAAESLAVAPLLADLLHTRGLVRRSAGDGAAAVRDLRAAVEHVERVRGALQAEQFRAAYHGRRLSIYEDLVTTACQAGDAAAAFDGIERAKSRLLLDMISRTVDATGAAGELGGPLAAELAARRADLNAAYSRLADARAGDVSEESLARWQNEIRASEKALVELESRLATTGGVAALFAPPVTLEQTRARLEAGVALIEYFVADGRLVALVLRRDGQRIVGDLGDAEEVSEQVRRVQFQLHRAERPGALDGPRGARLLADAQFELAALAQLIFAPLEPLLSAAERLIVIPHGPLHTIPFQALRDAQGRYLVERFTISVAPSASLLLRTSDSAAARRGDLRAAIIGVADAHAPWIEHEARALAAAIPGSRLALHAGADDLARLVQRADVVHIACHGQFSSENPLASGLKLSDRWLTLREIYGLSLDAELVTLSGCETGRSAVDSGDELIGLARGFFAAGTRALLVSLWRVNDESTAELMHNFYKCAFYNDVRSGLAGALREAQLSCLRTRPHPVLWASFVLMGGL